MIFIDFMPFIRFILVFLLLFGSFGEFLSAQRRVTCESYSVEDGLSQNSVSDMVKDKAGFAWLATHDGLSRFDGFSFRNYKASSKLIGRSVSNQFERLIADEKGFVLKTEQKQQVEGSKRPKKVEVEIPFGYDEVKYVKYVISLK